MSSAARPYPLGKPRVEPLGAVADPPSPQSLDALV